MESGYQFSILLCFSIFIGQTIAAIYMWNDHVSPHFVHNLCFILFVLLCLRMERELLNQIKVLQVKCSGYEM